MLPNGPLIKLEKDFLFLSFGLILTDLREGADGIFPDDVRDEAVGDSSGCHVQAEAHSGVLPSVRWPGGCVCGHGSGFE